VPRSPDLDSALQQQIRLLQEQASQLSHEKAGLQARVLELEREAGAAARRAEERIAELERRAREREAALQQKLDAAEGRARGLAPPPPRAPEDAGSVARAVSGGVSTASLAELEAATRGFAADGVLGRGGFGPVYRGEWGGQAVAVKRLDPDSLQGVREAVREVTVLGSYRHPHLVPLLCFSLAPRDGRQDACLVRHLTAPAFDRRLTRL
jgi:hypothetical protein